MGWGEFSEILTLVAAKVPEKPLPPQTVITNIFVRIQWDEPYLNSSPILAYEIQVADADGKFAVEDYYCDGAEEPCLSQRYCEIPMSVLRSSSYNFVLSDLVVAKIRARNQYGWSLLSEANIDGARIQTAPAQVLNLLEDNELTSEEQLVFRWSLLETEAETGGTEIISYNVQFDKGTNGE